MNTYVYHSDSGLDFAVDATPETAAFMSMSLSVTPLPRFRGKAHGRKVLLVGLIDGHEQLVIDPAPFWTYALGDVVAYGGEIALVAVHFDERGRSAAEGH